MLKRMFQSLLVAVLTLAGLLCSLIPLRLLWLHLEETSRLALLLLWLGGASLAVLLAAGFSLRRIWFFAGSGDPVRLEVLRERLLAVNELDCPVAAQVKRKSLRLGWRVREQPWCELLSHRDIRVLPELRCRFDAETRTVLLSDRVRSVRWLFCPDQVTVGRACLALPLLRARQAKPGIIGDYATMTPYDYQLHRREIKSAVMGTILACGWNVRFSLF